MQFEDILKWLGLVSLVLTVINMAWNMVNRGTKDFVEKQGKHEVKLTDHDRRIQKLENDGIHLPKAEQVAELNLLIAKMEGSLGKLEVSVEGMTHRVRRIDDYLQEHKL